MRPNFPRFIDAKLHLIANVLSQTFRPLMKRQPKNNYPKSRLDGVSMDFTHLIAVKRTAKVIIQVQIECFEN